MQLLNNINSFVTVKADNRLSEQSSEISSIKSTQADSQKAPIPEPLQPVSLNSEDPFSRIDRFIGNALNSSLGKVFTQVGEKEISDLQPTKIKTVQNLFLSEINNHIENGSANGVTQSSFENMINSASEASQSAHQAVEAILADMGSLGEKEKANLIHSDKVIQAGLKHLSQRIDSKEEDSLPEQMMEFLIETNEEDQITINFNEDNGQLLHSYTVEGDISDEEQEALDTLFEEVVNFSSSFFTKTQNRELSSGMNISESFNSEQLSGFAINYSGYNDNQNQSLSLTEDRDVLRYEYQIEQATNTQSLNFQIDFEHQVLDLDLSTSTNGSYDDDSVSVVLQQLSSNIESHKKNISSKVERGTSSLNIISSNESLLADSLSNMLKSTKTDQSQVTFISDKVASSDYRQGLSVANTERPSVSALSDFEMFFLVDKDNAFKFSQNTDVSDKDNGQELIQELHFKSQSSMWGTEDAERNYTFTSVITENTETTNVLIGGGGEIAQVTFNVEDFSTSYSARTVSIEGIGNRPGEDLPPEIYEEKVFSRSSSYKMNEVDTSTTEEVTHNIASYFLKELASVRGISKHEERVIQQLVIKE